ncbi:MAG TPA: PAS domain-containing sensor histidine kinase [Mesorhizobium sp.]|jgi:sigma-B regulation protein RsbU (phosphoserine phosphatase)|uniref:PAS domain-containing sensor histidine kinase n=1 Tax=Mesorhizobium sp. TaxID=1871066 RepID=UPI002DDCBB89|nr:PAS domain-containing sensor histidine kinase [Mesorhizobium sp.]HEV2503757.1 PAS domain-containing sensor histidine kinase [Mesorhizobium sp.]
MEEDLEDLYENAPCGYVSLGTDGRILKSNRTFSTWTGYEQQALIGKRLRDLLNVAGAIFYETHFAPLLRMQGFFSEVALDLLAADGNRLAVLLNARERRDEQGELMFIRLTIFPATERRRYERGLVAARLEAEQDLKDERAASELREQFVAVLGHDLRNPLAGIDAGLRLLQRVDGDTRTNTILEQMRRSVARMHELINNVLDLTRSRLGGGISLRIDPDTALGPVLMQVIEEIRVVNPDRTFVVDLDINEPVDCDHNRIGQLLSNLLGNAITHGKEDRPVHIEGRTREGEFSLAVSNAGDPIPADTMKQLFQPFYRAESRSNAEGLGLGLYIASQIARAHHGTLSVTSDSLRTTFAMSMPTRQTLMRYDTIS